MADDRDDEPMPKRLSPNKFAEIIPPGMSVGHVGEPGKYLPTWSDWRQRKLADPSLSPEDRAHVEAQDDECERMYQRDIYGD